MGMWIKLLIVGGLTFIVILFARNSSLFYSADLPIMKGTTEKAMQSHVNVNWKTIDLFEKPIPDITHKLKDDVLVTKETARVKNVDVFYRKAQHPDVVQGSGQTVLLLHGQAFTSETWDKLGTLQLLAAMGHRVIAFDLPGYGNSKREYSGNKAEFLAALMKAVGVLNVKPVVISPSMSGQYSVPFVASHWELLSGYVPVAPVASGTVPKEKLEAVQIPTLLLFGDQDKSGLAETSRKHLGVIPLSREVVFKGAGHPAYLDEPDLFHQLLFNFLALLRSQ